MKRNEASVDRSHAPGAAASEVVGGVLSNLTWSVEVTDADGPATELAPVTDPGLSERVTVPSVAAGPERDTA